MEKTCHGCGLESADDCPEKHIPADPDLKPCKTCIRNPELKPAEHVITDLKDSGMNAGHSMRKTCHSLSGEKHEPRDSTLLSCMQAVLSCA